MNKETGMMYLYRNAGLLLIIHTKTQKRQSAGPAAGDIRPAAGQIYE